MSWLKKNKISLTIILLCCSFLFFQLQPAGAQGGFLWTNTGNCYSSGTCSSCDIVQIIVNIGVFLLGIVGAVALVFFTYGAFILLVSGGVGERVQKAKGIMTNAVIGLIIALSAYFIVTTVISIITGGWTWEGKLTCPSAAPAPSAPPAPSPSTPPPPPPTGNCGTDQHKADGYKCMAVPFDSRPCFIGPELDPPLPNQCADASGNFRTDPATGLYYYCCK